MARRLRSLPGGVVFHVMNRASMGVRMFSKRGDYLSFEKALGEGRKKWPGVRVLAYCVMPTHFHMVVWPREEGEVSAFLQWVTMTFSARWHAHRASVGRGRVFQGRFKSFPVQRDGHVLSVCRYVERNALRAGLVERAEAWRWSSLGCRFEAAAGDGLRAAALIDEDWPVDRGDESAWMERVNEAETPEELTALRRSVVRGSPFGGAAWGARMARQLGIESSMRERGRPKGGRGKWKKGV